MLGDEQEKWLLDGLNRSQERWNVLANQVPLRGEAAKAGGDKWHGYLAQRDRVLQFLAEREPPNPVVVTGDVHNNQVADLLADFDDPGSEIVGTEFIGTSITSGGDGRASSYGPFDDPRFKLRNSGQRGYVRVNLSPESLRADYRMVETVDSPTSKLIQYPK